MSDEEDRRVAAEVFAKAVTACLTTIDLLPPDWHQRAVAIINAAYPKTAAKPTTVISGQLTGQGLWDGKIGSVTYGGGQ